MSHTYDIEWQKRLKESHWEVKDDKRSVRLSTTRTVVNGERVRHEECNDRRVTVRMIVNQLDIKMTVWRIITEELDMFEK